MATKATTSVQKADTTTAEPEQSRSANTSLAQRAKAATTAREKAQKALIEAESGYEKAKATQTDVERRLASTGQITREEHDDAIFESKRAAGVVSAAKAALADAVRAEQVAVAQAAASELIGGQASREGLGEAIKDAVSNVEDSLGAVLAAVDNRNTALSEAMSAALNAGLVEGKASPEMPILVRHNRNLQGRHTGSVLLVDGEPEAQFDPSSLVVDALGSVFRAVGLSIEAKVAGGAR